MASVVCVGVGVVGGSGGGVAAAAAAGAENITRLCAVIITCAVWTAGVQMTESETSCSLI